MTRIPLLALLSLSCIVLSYSQCIPPTIAQTAQSAWEEGGYTYTLVTAEIKNSGSAPLKSVVIDITGHSFIKDLWEMVYLGSGIFYIYFLLNIITNNASYLSFFFFS